MLKKHLIIIGVILALVPQSTYAQNYHCNVDLSTVAALIFQAQAGFSSGDNSTGLSRLSQAQALIENIQSSCEGAPPVIPTAQPTPLTSDDPSEPTPAPTTIEGDQVYNSPDGLFSVTFPANWIASGSDRSVLIGTSQNALVALSMVTNPLESGEKGATIIINQLGVLVPNAQSIEDVVTFYQQLFNSELSVTVGTAQAVEIDGRVGQGFRYNATGYSGFLLVVPLDEEEVLLLFAIAPLGEDITLPREAIDLAKNVRLGNSDE